MTQLDYNISILFDLVIIVATIYKRFDKVSEYNSATKLVNVAVYTCGENGWCGS